MPPIPTTDSVPTMTVNNMPKFIILLASLISLTVLMITSTISSESGMVVISGIVGYGIGNGVAAKKDEPSEPTFGPKRHG